MLNARLFRFWNDLPEALLTGKPQNEIKHGQKGMFEELYEELPRLEQFMGAMTGLSRINFEAFAAKFNFSNFKTLCDIGELLACFALKSQRNIPTSTALPLICLPWSRSRKNTLHPPGSMAASAPLPAISSKIRYPKPTSSRWA
jgi:hypothetical protein